MDDYTEDISPELEGNDHLTSDSEEDGPAPELVEAEPEGPAPEHEREEDVAPAPEPEEPAPEPVELEPEAPPSEESGSVGTDAVQNLIGAIGDLNQTITDAMTEGPEQLPVEDMGGGAGEDTGGEVVEEPATVDLTPVVRALGRTNELLEQQDKVLLTQHNDLLQLQANLDFVFLAVSALIGVVLGAAVALVLNRVWRT